MFCVCVCVVCLRGREGGTRKVVLRIVSLLKLEEKISVDEEKENFKVFKNI